MKSTRRHAAHRVGFTLIELLVVISIIAFLLSISLFAIGNALGIARERATQATIMKLHGLINQRVEAFNRALDRNDLRGAIELCKRKLRSDPRLTPEMRFSVNNASDKTWEILARKQFFALKFPQYFNEDRNGNGQLDSGEDLSQDLTDISGAGNGVLDPDGWGANLIPLMTNPELHNRRTESSELLYWTLTKSEVYGIPPVDENEFTSSEVRDTDGDGLLEFVDSWGNPLQFYRTPTRLFRCGEDFNGDGSLDAGEDLNGNSTLDGPGRLSPIVRGYALLLFGSLPPIIGSNDPLARDPDDALGRIEAELIDRGTSGGAANRAARYESIYHTPSTYHAFLIVSSGPDGGRAYTRGGQDDPLGLYEPWDTSRAGHLGMPIKGRSLNEHPLNDNLSNRKPR